MREAKNEESSWFLISLDPKNGKGCFKSNLKRGSKTKISLVKSKSFDPPANSSDYMSNVDDYEENEDLIDSISVIEESNSWIPNNDSVFDMRRNYKSTGKCSKKYSRKEKSLGELCKKFIYLYGSKTYCIIALDECTHTLGVERRRIYDIINILESFNVLSRLAKNQYEWKGIDQIYLSIQKMRSANDDEEIASNSMKKRKKKKSLGILCESFIKQFLTWRSTISLEQAARRISDTKIDESKLKTKVRRLYDIANVLAALNLIEKTSLETRKPAFKWVGEHGLQNFIEEMDKYFSGSQKAPSSDEESQNSKQAGFKTKSNSWGQEEHLKSNKGYKRINSGSTTNTYKNVLYQEDEELTFGNAPANSSRVSYHNGILNAGTSQLEVNLKLIELLEKLVLNPRKHPVYKPTPIYPINHFLSNSYTVSVNRLI